MWENVKWNLENDDCKKCGNKFDYKQCGAILKCKNCERKHIRRTRYWTKGSRRKMDKFSCGYKFIFMGKHCDYAHEIMQVWGKRYQTIRWRNMIDLKM